MCDGALEGSQAGRPAVTTGYISRCPSTPRKPAMDRADGQVAKLRPRLRDHPNRTLSTRSRKRARSRFQPGGGSAGGAPVSHSLGLHAGAAPSRWTGNRAGLFSVFLRVRARLRLVRSTATVRSEVLNAAEATALSIIARIGSRRRMASDVALPGNLRVFRTRGRTGRRPLRARSALGSLARLRRGGKPRYAGRRVETGAAAVLKVTSGSSDRPKAIVTTESNLWHDGRHITAAMDISTADVNLGSIPLSHSYGLGNLVMPLLVGGTPVVLRDAFIPRASRHMVTARHGLSWRPFMFEFTSENAGPVFPLRFASADRGAPLDFRGGGGGGGFHARFGRKTTPLLLPRTGALGGQEGPAAVGVPLDGGRSPCDIAELAKAVAAREGCSAAPRWRWLCRGAIRE